MSSSTSEASSVTVNNTQAQRTSLFLYLVLHRMSSVCDCLILFQLGWMYATAEKTNEAQFCFSQDERTNRTSMTLASTYCRQISSLIHPESYDPKNINGESKV